MEKVREPLYKVIWAGKDVSKDVSPYLLSLTYTDHLHGANDEIEMTFEDRDERWKNKWYPQKGDKVEIKIGIKEDADKWLKCGSFEIDEIELQGPPDVINVKGLSAPIKKSLRKKKTEGWENTTLSQVISSLAGKNKLETQLEIDPDIQFSRLDQRDANDLAFIKELADRYGYITKIDSGRLIFVKPKKLEGSNPVATIERGKFNLRHYNFKDKTHGIFKACEVRYWDPVTKETIVHEEKDDAKDMVSEDTLKLSERVENKQQAIERAKAELKRHNQIEKTGSLTCVGNPHLTAGAIVKLKGFFALDGKYLIEEAKHSVSKGSGYETSIECRRVL